MNKPSGGRRTALKITICAAFLALFGAAIFSAPAAKIRPLAAFPDADAAAPQSCAACHQSDVHSWQQTLHRKTVQKATVETVRGDFTRDIDWKFADAGVEVGRAGDDFFIRIGGDFYRVAAIVGAKHIEQYVGEKAGEFYSLPVVFDLAEKRWIDLNDADFQTATANVSRHLRNWKTDCAACHQPGGAPDFSDGFGDFGIGCAACHADAAEHLAAQTSLRTRLGFAAPGETVNPRDLSSDAAMLICAACHNRDAGGVPPEKVEKIETVEKIAAESSREPLSAHQASDFDRAKRWADGSYKFSGSEYDAVRRSVCYAQSKAGGHGVAGEKINCASCHSAHAPDAESSAVQANDQNCISCHAEFTERQAIAEHTRHRSDSEASRCASCHQPATVFGRTGFVRTHEITVPNPVLTAEKGIPNACNLCHTDRSVNWAIRSSKNFWTERFLDAEISTDSQFDRPEAARALSSGDSFWRALAADSMRRHSDPAWARRFLIEAAANESSPLVRRFLDRALRAEADSSNAEP